MSSTESSSAESQSLPTGSPCWVEIPALDVPRAKRFYATVFNFTFSENPPQPSPYTDDNLARFQMPGCNNQQHGGIVKKESAAELHKATCVYLYAKDIEGVKAHVEKEGGKIVGKTEKEGEYGVTQKFEDCEGNLGGLFMMAGN